MCPILTQEGTGAQRRGLKARTRAGSRVSGSRTLSEAVGSSVSSSKTHMKLEEPGRGSGQLKEVRAWGGPLAWRGGGGLTTASPSSPSTHSHRPQLVGCAEGGAWCFEESRGGCPGWAGPWGVGVQPYHLAPSSRGHGDSNMW